MRISFLDLSRPKATAKALASLSPQLKLCRVQDVLAQVLLYRDWHDLSANGRGNTPATADDATLMHVITGLAAKLDLEAADVQHVVSKARLLSPGALPLETQLRLCTAIWRRNLGALGRGKAGTMVKVKTHGTVEAAYLQEAGRPTFLLFDSGLGDRADFTVVTPREPPPDFLPSCLWLPYGYWILKDGSEIIFSRDYFPLWRVTDLSVERLDPWLWINGITEQRHFANSAATNHWHYGSARELALRHLSERRISSLPRLVNVMAYLFEPGVRKLSHSVERLCVARGASARVPTYAHLNSRFAFVS